MKIKRWLSVVLTLSMIIAVLPMRIFAEEYCSLKDLANANGYEYFYYADNETVNVRSASYILSFQNNNSTVAYKTVLDDVGTITLNSNVIKEDDTLYVSKLDAQTKLIKYFPNTTDSVENEEPQITSAPVFTKSQPTDWAQSEVNNAIRNNLVTDNVQKNYQADITREYFCELVIKLYEKISGETVTAAANVFKDTSNPEILKAYKLGIVNGVSSTEFAPNSLITRQEICTMLVRAIGAMYDNIDTTDYQYHNFNDIGQISSWAMDSVQFAFDNNVMQGVGDNKIDPLGNATCEQAILLVNRIYKNRADFGEKNKDAEDVIETLKRLDFDDNSEVNGVSVSFGDGSDTKGVRIKEIDSDDLIYTTTGIKGSAVNITSSKSFDTATISFDYNPQGLGNTNANDLAVGWYNTDLDRIEILESKVDTYNHTVSVETTHFSEYILVDSKEWYSVWQQGQTIIRKTDDSGNYAENFNVQLVMDCSGSMSSDMIARSQQVIYEFIERLSDNDKFSVVHFGTSASTVISCERKSDADMNTVKQNVMSQKASGSTNYRAALEMCKSNIDYYDDNYTNIIVFLTDGSPDSSSAYQDLLEEFADNNVRIAAVGLQTETTALKELAEKTNGQCLYAYSNDSLEVLYESIQGSMMGVDATDTDGDGIPDVIEIIGMKTRYGTIIKTDPNKYDTDGDGKSDSEEMGKLIETDELTDMDRKKGITQNVYYEYLSDPVEGHEVVNKVANKIAGVDIFVSETDINKNGEFDLNIDIIVKEGTAKNVQISLEDSLSTCLDYSLLGNDIGFVDPFFMTIKCKELPIGEYRVKAHMQCMNIYQNGFCTENHYIPILIKGDNFEPIKMTAYGLPKYKTVAFDFDKNDIKESKSLTMREWHPLLGLTKTMIEIDDDAEALVENIPIALEFTQFLMSWINNAQEITHLNANISKSDLLCLKYGQAIELNYSGKKTTLSMLIKDKYYNVDPTIVFTCDDEADRLIREWFNLSGSGKYYMECNFGRVYLGDYGYYLIIENGEVYQVPIIHKDTKLQVYYKENGQSTLILDAADILRHTRLKMSDDEKNKVIEQLNDNGFKF